MKKLLTISLCAALVLGLTACGGAPSPSSSSAPSISVVPSTPETAPESTPESGSAEEQSLPPIPADSAMYRGTVTEVIAPSAASGSPQPAAYQITLEQAEGTDFGAPSLKFAFTADTYADFTPEQGQYLEVYYGAAMGQPLDVNAVHDVLTAIKYHSAEMVNYNGYVKEINQRTDKPGEGWIMMVPTKEETVDNSSTASGESSSSLSPVMTPGNEIRFNYHKEQTQFYLNFDEIKVGDRLNIFQSGAMTMSIPPQSFAIEVRNYAEAAAK